MGTLRILVICTIVSGLLIYEGATVLVDIDISSYDPKNEETHSYYEFVEKFDDNLTEIIVKSNNSNNHQGFFTVQAHSSHYNISLGHFGNGLLTKVGHNIGIVQFFMGPFTNSFNLKKLTDENITVLVTVIVYGDTAPVPGGCSKLVNVTEKSISPIIETIDGEEIITIQVTAPSLKGFSCSAIVNETVIEVYQKFLPGQNFGTYDYYRGILSMLSINDIRKNGKLVSTNVGEPNLQKIFSSYIGVGEVFAVIVTVNKTSSAYVPSISFGKDINELIENQKKGSSGFFVTLCTIAPILALVIIYRGHAFFTLTTFLLGTSCGTIISLLILSQGETAIGDGTLIQSLLLGMLYGLVWMGIWYKCGYPLLSAMLTFLHAAVLLSCIIFYTGIADHELFHKGSAYWSVFFSIIISCWFILSVITMFGHIFACALLGSYILVLTSLNHWMNGNMQYIVINVYRRIYVPNFNFAILNPPYQPRDFIISFCGLLFLIHGFRRQMKNQIGKPPFPPHTSRHFSGEYTPLL